MIRRLIILDAFLILMLVLGGVAIRNQWKSFNAGHQVSAIIPEPEAFPTVEQASAAQPATAATDWTDISARNLFSFDRNDIVLLASEPAEGPKPPGPKPFLFGTLSIGSEKMAMLAPAGNRSYRPMKVGELIDGWTVTEIQDKSVVVTGNAIRQTLVMNDPTGLIPRDTTRTTVTAIAPAAIPAAIPQPAPAFTSTPTPAAPGSAPRKMRLVDGPLGPRMVEVPD
jgi:hypothetical protein